MLLAALIYLVVCAYIIFPYLLWVNYYTKFQFNYEMIGVVAFMALMPGINIALVLISLYYVVEEYFKRKWDVT